MTRFNRVRAKARSRSDSRSPANSRPRGKPQEEPEPKPRQNQKYAERARKRAIRNAEENAKRMPELNLQMVAQDTMEKFGFEHKLSLVVNAKANAHDGFTIKKVGETLRDLRHLLWVSIDSYYERGVDQIAYCERGQRRELLVKVAIADVDAFAPKGSILDEHAKTNAASVYPGKEAYPMLPEQLSGDLSAFPADCDRLAIVIEFAVLPRGNVRFGKIYRAYVRNKAELSSGEIGAWLEGAGSDAEGELPEMFEEMPELAEQIKLQDEASLRLSRYRAGEVEAREARVNAQARESEAEPQEDAKAGAQEAAGATPDKTLGLCVTEKDRAKMIIENFMVCANKGMLALLETARFPPIRRVVVVPKDWQGIMDAAAAKGFPLPSEPDAQMLSEFLAKEKKENPEGFSGLSAEIAKMLGPGEYALFDKREPVEYFCIADTDYLAGTMPNQKYMDLVIQRLVKAAVAHTPTPYSKADLVELAAWCTERENAARKVERAVKFAGASEKP